MLKSLKLPKTGKVSYADLAKKFETKKYVDLLNSKDADAIQMTTAQLMIQQNNAKLEELFGLQEQNKISGVHGPQVQQNAQQEQQEQEAQQAQMQAEQMEQPMMKYGGYHLPMYQNAGKTGKKIVGTELNKSGTKVRITYSDGTTELQDYVSKRPSQSAYQSTKPTWAIQNQVPATNVPATPSTNKQAPKTTTKAKTAQVSNVPSGYREGIWSGDIYPSQNPKIQIPFLPETSRTWNAMTDFKSIKDYADAVGYTGQLDPKDIAGTSYKIQEFVEKTYPEIVKKYHSESFYGLPKTSKKVKDSILGIRWQDIGKEIQGLKNPPTATSTTIKEEEKKELEQKQETPTPQVNQTYEVPGLNLGIALPNVYERMPLNYYKIEPEYIDPRYLDVQPELNEIGRVERAFQTNLGSRGASDMANLLQQKANTLGRIGQVYGTKYNYDRAQDAAAQQFNAQAKMNIDQYNQGSWFQQLEDPIRRRESLIGTQQMMDDQAAIENSRKMQAFYGNKDYIGDTFFPYQKMTMQDLLGNLDAAKFFKQYQTDAVKQSKVSKDDEEKTEEKTEVKKYGGKVKKKIKIKPKLKNSYF